MAENVKPQDAREPIASNDVVVLDIRDEDEWSAGAERIPGSIHIAAADLEARLGELPDDKRILLVCPDGTRSTELAGQIDCEGRELIVLDGGVESWKKSKLQTQPSPDAAPPKGEDEPPHEGPGDEEGESR